MSGMAPGGRHAEGYHQTLELLRGAATTSGRAVEDPDWGWERPGAPDEIACLVAARQRIDDERYGKSLERAISGLASRPPTEVQAVAIRSSLTLAATWIESLAEAFLETASRAARDLAWGLARGIAEIAWDHRDGRLREIGSGEPAGRAAAARMAASWLRLCAAGGGAEFERPGLAVLRATVPPPDGKGSTGELLALASAQLDAYELTADPLQLHRAFAAIVRCGEADDTAGAGEALALARIRYGRAMGMTLFDHSPAPSALLSGAGRETAQALATLRGVSALSLRIAWWGGGTPPDPLMRAALAFPCLGKALVFRRERGAGSGRVTAEMGERRIGPFSDPDALCAGLGEFLAELRLRPSPEPPMKTLTPEPAQAGPADHAGRAMAVVAASPPDEPGLAQPPSNEGSQLQAESGVAILASPADQEEGAWTGKVPGLGALVAFLVALVEILTRLVSGKEPTEAGRDEG